MPLSPSHSFTGTKRYRRQLPHIQEEGRSFFVTFRTKGARVLSKQERDTALESALCVHGQSAIIHGVVIMPDHAHLILTPLTDAQGDTYPLSYILKRIKGQSARRINQAMDRTGSVWQHESFDHMLRSWESAEAKVRYICNNPVRKGLVKRPEDYTWLWRLSTNGDVTHKTL